jgi:hexosaminidase
MNKRFIITAVLLLTAVSTVVAHPIIPAPALVMEKTGCFVFAQQPGYSIQGVVSLDFPEYIESLPFKLTRSGNWNAVKFHIGNSTPEHSPEGYRLAITPSQITIEAVSEAGAFYALQTLQQLSSRNETGCWCVPCVVVEDTPRFPYRGVMLDVSRHFRTKDFIFKQLDAMAFFKLNKLHLHLTDGAGWRIEIKEYPRLTEFAAWRPYPTWQEWWANDRRYCDASDPLAHGGFYTQDDIREIVEYARQRHITVIPEIEMPGHSEEVLAAYPQLSCSGKPYAEASFCPGNEQVYQFLETVLTEVMKLFPSEYIHIGGDEAGKEAWKICPKCQARMHEEGLENVEELQSYLIRRIGRFLNDHGRQLIGWDEILEGGLAPNATVMAWRGEEGGLKAIRAGHNVIMTPGAYCYLDYTQDAPFTQPLSIGGYTPLQKVYEFSADYPELSLQEQSRLLGLQANLFTEYIPTDEHMEYMLYPRVLAIAETAWSNPESRNYKDFRHRALLAIEHLQQRGYKTFDLAHEYGERPESLQPVQHLAVDKKVIYTTPWHEKYPAKGAATLTDGIIGGWTYTDRRWQGFLNSDCEITTDLGCVQPIHYVGITFMQSTGPYVWMPRQVEIYTSNDGMNFQPLTTIHNDISEKCPELLFKTFAYTGCTTARYIRCIARSNGIPGGWLFADELIVQ